MLSVYKICSDEEINPNGMDHPKPATVVELGGRRERGVRDRERGGERSEGR